MSLIRDIALRNALRPRVAHSVPGRLRLRFPALKHVPEDSAQAEALLGRLFRVAVGVDNVKMDPRTGSVVVEYNRDATGEDDIMAYVGGLMALVRKHWDRFSQVNDGDVGALADRLEEWLKTVAYKQSFLKHKIAIPDDVWP
jgi:hypothetical protein